jgi:hypothetical protein
MNTEPMQDWACKGSKTDVKRARTAINAARQAFGRSVTIVESIDEEGFFDGFAVFDGSVRVGHVKSCGW